MDRLDAILEALLDIREQNEVRAAAQGGSNG
jgi:hypothetical protein